VVLYLSVYHKNLPFTTEIITPGFRAGDRLALSDFTEIRENGTKIVERYTNPRKIIDNSFSRE